MSLPDHFYYLQELKFYTVKLDFRTHPWLSLGARVGRGGGGGGVGAVILPGYYKHDPRQFL